MQGLYLNNNNNNLIKNQNKQDASDKLFNDELCDNQNNQYIPPMNHLSYMESLHGYIYENDIPIYNNKTGYINKSVPSAMTMVNMGNKLYKMKKNTVNTKKEKAYKYYISGKTLESYLVSYEYTSKYTYNDHIISTLKYSPNYLKSDIICYNSKLATMMLVTSLVGLISSLIFGVIVDKLKNIWKIVFFSTIG